MKIILHVGMGKTGTSTIQRCLDLNGEALAQAGVDYMGMWFDAVDPAFHGMKNQGKFFALTPEEQRAAAQTLHARLSARPDRDTFVYSNESLAGKSATLSPFLDQLIALGVDLRVICYIRNPTDWLPSAYAQWGIRHKREPGPIPPYGQKAKRLVRWYQGPLDWHDRYGDRVDLRSYDAAGDVVADFGAALGVTLAPLPQRQLERAEPAELILRAQFNESLAQATMPNVFDRAVLPSMAAVPPLDELISRYFDHSATGEILAENQALFDRLTLACGFDPRIQGKSKPAPEPGQVRDRLVDALLTVVLSQAQRITKIEAALKSLTEKP